MSLPAQHQSHLPPSTVHITTHEPTTGTSIIHSSTPAPWTPGDASKPTYNVALIHSTSRTPASVNSSLDLTEHASALKSGAAAGVPKNGSSFRMLDIAPGYTTSMHRTVTLDYGIVVEGTIELVCDGNEEVGKGEGEVRKMERGDASVMRGTMHAWRNPSLTEWARVAFVVLDMEKVEVKGEKLGEVWN